MPIRIYGNVLLYDSKQTASDIIEYISTFVCIIEKDYHFLLLYEIIDI